MKATVPTRPVVLGEYIVADPKICHGQPTYKGTRILAWVVLEQVERGMTWDQITREWNKKISQAAIAETISLSHLIRKNQSFQGFHARARRKHSRQPEAFVA